MFRQNYNRKILKELEKLIDKYPDQRFGQLIANYIFPYYRQRDIFYEESQKTFENIELIKESTLVSIEQKIKLAVKYLGLKLEWSDTVIDDKLS